jgi:hypothetical protein
MEKEWDTVYFSIGVPLTLFLGVDLLPLVKDMESAPLLKKMNELRKVLGFDKIRIIDDKETLKPMEYEFDSYGKVLLKETVTFEEASDKILQSLEKILISDDENILKWKREIEDKEKTEQGLKPDFTYSATIDGVKKGPFSANELSEIFEKGGFNSILLDKGEN